MDVISSFFYRLDIGTWLMIGFFLMFAGFIWGIIAAYKEDIRLGRWILMAPILTLSFCATHPAKGIPPLILQLVGGGIFIKAGLSLMQVSSS